MAVYCAYGVPVCEVTESYAPAAGTGVCPKIITKGVMKYV